MIKNEKLIIEQIDRILADCTVIDTDSQSFGEQIEFRTRLRSAIERYAPLNSVYLKEAEKYPDDSYDYNVFARILKALRDDIDAGYLNSITELIHADIFSDFLEMAEHLIEQKYKDPAAVIAGSVLEEHLRKLCNKSSICIHKPDGKPKQASALNAELAGAVAYSKLDEKNVTAWLDLRNKAAHGNYDNYTKDQVMLLIQSIRDFITRNPA